MKPSNLTWARSLTPIAAFVMTIALHWLFPVASQANYVSTISKSESRAQLEEYIHRLEIDFGTSHDQDVDEKLRSVMDDEKN